MVSLEKALLLNLSTGFSIGAAWRGLKVDPIAPSDIPDTLLLEGINVAELRQLWQKRARPVVDSIEALSASADTLLTQGPWSVTDKTKMGSGFDPHDYLSLAKYWWPTPGRPDGLPYINRDGEVNPDCYSERYDLPRLDKLSEAILVLALSSFITGNLAHRERALHFLRVWFVDPATRQNPTFLYAQHIPGKDGLRWAGIIEARRYIYIVEGIRLLSAQNPLPEKVATGLHTWFSDFLRWLRSSEQGIQAASGTNNIAFWYDLLCVSIAWFTGNDSLARHIVMEQSLPRLDSQVSSDGALEREIARAKPYDYLAFTLTALAGLSAAGKRFGIDLWTVQNSEGRTFEAAYEWLRSLPVARELQLGVAHLADGGSVNIPYSVQQDTALYLALLTRVAEARRHRLIELRRSLHAREEQLAGLQKITSELVTLRDSFEKKSLEREKISSELHAANRSLQAKEEQLAKLESELQRVSSESMSLQNALTQQKAEAGRLATECAVLQDSLKRRNNECEGISNELLVAGQSLQSKEKHINAITEKNACLVRDLADAVSRGVNLKQDATQVAAKMKEKIVKQDTRIRELVARLEYEKAFRQREKARANEMKARVSYRISKIFRFLDALFPSSVKVPPSPTLKVADAPISPASVEKNNGKRSQQAEVKSALDEKIDRLRRLVWSGYSIPAISELCGIRDNVELPNADRAKAAEAVSLRSFYLGDYALAHSNIGQYRILKKHPSIRPAFTEILTLLKLNRLDEADKCLHEARRRFDQHVGWEVLGAAILRRRFLENGMSINEASVRYLAALSEMFTKHELAPLELVDSALPLGFDNVCANPVVHISSEKDPLVTVIIPAYNAAGVVSIALNGLLKQTYQNIEIIIVDDCSTDDTNTVVQKFIEKDKRIHLIRQPTNQGSYSARNAALRVAHGEFVMVHDTDDWSHPQKIERLAAQLRKSPEIKAVMAKWLRMDEYLDFVGPWKPKDTLFDDDFSSLLFRRSIIDDIGGWDTVRVGGDSSFRDRIQVVYGDPSVCKYPVPLALSLVRRDSLTRSSATHISSLLYGLRWSYRQSYQWNLVRSKQTSSPNDYATPACLIPLGNRVNGEGGEPYDMVFCGDFFESNPELSNLLQGLRVAATRVKRIAVYPSRSYLVDPAEDMAAAFFELSKEHGFDIVANGDHIACHSTIIASPAMLDPLCEHLPIIQTKEATILGPSDPTNGSLGMTGAQAFLGVEPSVGTLSEWCNRMAASIKRVEVVDQKLIQPIPCEGILYAQRTDQLGSRLDGILSAWVMARKLNRRTVIYMPEHRTTNQTFSSREIFDLPALAADQATNDIIFIDGNYQKNSKAVASQELCNLTEYPSNLSLIPVAQPVRIVEKRVDIDKVFPELLPSQRDLFGKLVPHPSIRAALTEAAAWIGGHSYVAVHIRRGDVIQATRQRIIHLKRKGFAEKSISDPSLEATIHHLKGWIKHFVLRVAPLDFYLRAVKEANCKNLLIFSDSRDAAIGMQKLLPQARIMEDFKADLNATQRAYLEILLIAKAKMAFSTRSNFARLGEIYGNAVYVDVRAGSSVRSYVDLFDELFADVLKNEPFLRQYCHSLVEQMFAADKTRVSRKTSFDFQD